VFVLFKDYFTLTKYPFPSYLNNFRGEPAITNLDWPFTPNHKASQNFATFTSSVLQLQLAFDLLIVRSISFGSNNYNFIVLSLSLRHFKLAITINSLAHYAKGTLLLML